MRKLTSWIVVVFILAIGSMLGIHWKQVQDLKLGWEYKDRQTERHDVAQSLVLALEQFRAESANFRRIPESQVIAAKNRIRAELTQGLNAFEKLSAPSGAPSGTIRENVDLLRNQFGEILVLAAKLEPMYYSRNVYQNPDMQKLHDSILTTLRKVSEQSRAGAATALVRLGTSETRSLGMLAGAALLATLMLGLILLQTTIRLTRPLKAMQTRIQELRTRGVQAITTKSLPGVYGQAEKIISELLATVDLHQQDRQRFINAIVTDLRPALTNLEASGHSLLVLPERSDAQNKVQTQEHLRRSLLRVSGVLDDLTDLLDDDFSRIRLNERIVDLGDLLAQVGKMLGGAGSTHEIRVSIPPLPVWASVDPQRLERVLINLASKQMLFQPQGGTILFSMSDPGQISGTAAAENATDGLEISVYSDGESGARAALDVTPSGPEQDLLRHWASQSGFGLSLAYKVARAHGGTITAAGVAGMRVLFTLKLPRERIALGLLGTGVRTRLLGGASQNPSSKMTIDS